MSSHGGMNDRNVGEGAMERNQETGPLSYYVVIEGSDMAATHLPA